MKQLTHPALLALLVVIGLGAAAFAGECTSCDKAWKTSGWCQDCSIGFFGSMKIHSSKLHAALTSKEVPAAKTEKASCTGCKTALTKSENCEPCEVSFAKGHAFRSPYAAALARGQYMDWSKEKKAKAYQKEAKTKAELTAAEKKAYKDAQKKNSCNSCVSAMNGAGWCSPCNVGFVGQYKYKDRVDHVEARKALTIIQRANAMVKRCESCAVAMATDGTCKPCSRSFKAGKKIRL